MSRRTRARKKNRMTDATFHTISTFGVGWLLGFWVRDLIAKAFSRR
jgi:hypothetical protein